MEGPLIGVDVPFAIPAAPSGFATPLTAFVLCSNARSDSGSWTVRMCFWSASDRVKLRSHSMVC